MCGLSLAELGSLRQCAKALSGPQTLRWLWLVLVPIGVSGEGGPRGADLPLPPSPTRLPCPSDSPGKNTGVGSLSLLQRIFPTQESNWSLLHCRQILNQLSYQVSLFTFMHWRRKWQPTPVFLPGESEGQGSLVGCLLWGPLPLRGVQEGVAGSN